VSRPEAPDVEAISDAVDALLDLSKESSHRWVSELLPSCLSELLPSCDCMAADLVRAVVADGSASGREPPRVVLILTWGACGCGSNWV
jgi:hypothetical protein